MNATDARKAWQMGLAEAQAKDWKLHIWASDAFTQMGLAYKDGYADAKAEDAALLAAAKKAYPALKDWEDAEQWSEQDTLAIEALEAVLRALSAAEGKE